MTDHLREGRPSMETTEDNISAMRLMIETDKNTEKTLGQGGARTMLAEPLHTHNDFHPLTTSQPFEFKCTNFYKVYFIRFRSLDLKSSMGIAVRYCIRTWYGGCKDLRRQYDDHIRERQLNMFSETQSVWSNFT
ncbi:hypothetical protein EVAR_80065_1 [Eumeta japonica]|uniref:Uncharacterized protein n=1 Tax=Eumeta variegata TaxID=151549 RepID=A0A4C1UE08_EUMVA|nr:hypothetical protein EVAR_80065_1 [Eumeta japonica]